MFTLFTLYIYIFNQFSIMETNEQIFLKTHHVFSGEELEKMWERVALTASESTAKQLIKTISEQNLFPFITANEACELLRVTRQTLNKSERKGMIEGHRFGGKKLYNRMDLIDFVENNNSKAEV